MSISNHYSGQFSIGALQRIDSLKTSPQLPITIAIPQVETIPGRGQFLKGKVKKQNHVTVSPELHKNMENAQRIQAFVEQKILHSQNYPQRSKLLRLLAKKREFEKYKKLIKSLNDRLDLIRASSSSFESIEKYKVGNCGEMAKVGFAFAEQENIPAEWWKIEGGDHSFLVIGSTQSADYRYWDRAAVVCDPWSMGLYPATHIETYLKNFITVSKVHRIYKTKIEPFNPHRHTLKKVK